MTAIPNTGPITAPAIQAFDDDFLVLVAGAWVKVIPVDDADAGHCFSNFGIIHAHMQGILGDLHVAAAPVIVASTEAGNDP